MCHFAKIYGFKFPVKKCFAVVLKKLQQAFHFEKMLVCWLNLVQCHFLLEIRILVSLKKVTIIAERILDFFVTFFHHVFVARKSRPLFRVSFVWFIDKNLAFYIEM